MRDAALSDAYGDHRRRLMSAAVAQLVAIAAGVLVAYFIVDVAVEGAQAGALIYYGTEFVLLASAGALTRYGTPQQQERGFLLLDIAFTLVVASRVIAATTTISGTVLMLSLKMLGVALIVPWSVRYQAISVSAALAGYGVFIALRVNLYDESLAVHQLIGPALAGFLSLAGARALDRARREVFDQAARLHDSEARLRKLLAERQEDTEVAQALARVASVVVGALNRPGLLDRLVEETARLLEADFAHVLLYDERNEVHYFAAGFGDPPEMWEAIRILRVPHSAVPDIWPELEAHGFFQSGPHFERPVLPCGFQQPYGITLAMFVQLQEDAKPLGLIDVGFRGRREPFSPRQVRILRGIGRVASLGLANARLFDELEKASRVKSDFVASMSHELRTPLNVLLGYHELLLGEEFGPLTQEQRDTLERLQVHSRQLLELINATLDLSRIEAGRVDIQRAPVDFHILFETLRIEAAEAWPGSAPRFAWMIPAVLPVLDTDAVKLKVIVKNLISNAVKFSAGSAVRVAAQVVADGVEISVEDEGIGIAPEARAVIFEPFAQADETISPRFGGAGLGLHIARRLVEMLGGSIAVESELGRGATFRVWLPLSER